MTDFRTFNFGSSFQVHILSLSHVVILEGKCFKIVSNQCHQHLITIMLELFFNTFFANDYNGYLMVKILILSFLCNLQIIENGYKFILKSHFYSVVLFFGTENNIGSFILAPPTLLPALSLFLISENFKLFCHQFIKDFFTFWSS